VGATSLRVSASLPLLPLTRLSELGLSGLFVRTVIFSRVVCVVFSVLRSVPLALVVCLRDEFAEDFRSLVDPDRCRALEDMLAGRPGFQRNWARSGEHRSWYWHQSETRFPGRRSIGERMHVILEYITLSSGSPTHSQTYQAIK